MKNLVILVSVIGNDSLNFKDLKKGIIDPLDPTTLPYLTTENFVRSDVSDNLLNPSN